MTYSDLILIILILAAVILGAVLFLQKWAAKKYGSQVAAIDKIKVNTNIFVIDKKKMRLKDADIPKFVFDSMPKFYGFVKLPLVKAKVGNKILTLVCDKDIFKSILKKKSYKVELAGIYISSFANSSKKQKAN